MRPSTLPDELMRALLQGGSRRKAIRRFRQETGDSRADALRAMNKFSQGHRSRSMLNSYADLILIVLVVVSMLLGALFP